MQIIPLQPVPNQTCTVNLAGQVSQVNVYQIEANLFLDLYVNNSLIVSGILAENLNRIVRSLYLGFAGDLVFCDNQGSDDPTYTGLGQTAAAHFSLLYIEAAELPPNEG